MRRIQLITTVALVAACTAPASAAAQSQDLRSPDTRDAARGAEKSTYQDLRSPDAKDAARPEPPVYQDLRSPDARDAARNLPPVTVPLVASPDASGGFDWGDAGIGAAGMLGLLGVAAGSILGAVQMRRRRHPHAIAH